MSLANNKVLRSRFLQLNYLNLCRIIFNFKVPERSEGFLFQGSAEQVLILTEIE